MRIRYFIHQPPRPPPTTGWPSRGGRRRVVAAAAAVAAEAAATEGGNLVEHIIIYIYIWISTGSTYLRISLSYLESNIYIIYV